MLVMAQNRDHIPLRYVSGDTLRGVDLAHKSRDSAHTHG